MSNALQAIDSIKTEVRGLGPEFKALLPSHISEEKFIQTCMMAIQKNQDLAHPDVDKPSLFLACAEAASDGLIPNGKEAALVIFNTNVGTREKKRYIKKVQYMPMIGGMKKLVRNSGTIKKWTINVVKENDYYEYELGDNERIVHRPTLKNRGATVAAYSIAVLTNGEVSRVWMDLEDLEAVRKTSKNAEEIIWKKHRDEMYKKTVARRHYKDLEHSPELDRYMDRWDKDFEIVDEDDVPDDDKPHHSPARIAAAEEGLRRQYPPDQKKGEVIEGEKEPEKIARSSAPGVEEILAKIDKATSQDDLSVCQDLIRSIGSQEDKQRAGKAMYLKRKELKL